jgi:hypothetical protein
MLGSTFILMVSLVPGQFVNQHGQRGFNPRGFFYNGYTGNTYNGPFETIHNMPPAEQVVLHSAQFMMDLNDRRKSHNPPLAPVDYALYLEASAMENNVHQVAMGTCDHYVIPKSAGQLVCHRPTWEAARNAWLSEPSNAAVLFCPRLKRIGLAQYRYYWTMLGEYADDLSDPNLNPRARANKDGKNVMRFGKPTKPGQSIKLKATPSIELPEPAPQSSEVRTVRLPDREPEPVTSKVQTVISFAPRGLNDSSGVPVPK